ncbi:hypothetical protein [Duganella sp. S19_KUP01_CR8]|uniref:hypothetical protein n=1 Tax=Duganella sp. S19_KUP01_CR8 TaxID=3025502 RepID=UPI002FCD6E4E
MPSHLHRYRFPYIFLIVIVTLAAVGLLAFWSINRNWSRYFSVALVLFTLILTVAATHSKRQKLTSLFKSGADIELPKARMKLVAEVMAGCALVAFITPYFQKGLEFDRQEKAPRFEHYQLAARMINEQLSPQFCASRPSRTITCGTVAKGLDSLFWALVQGDEALAARCIDSIILNLQSELSFPEDADRKTKLANTIDELRGLDLTDSVGVKSLSLLPLLSLLFVSLAVSSKIAVAWHEYEVRRLPRALRQVPNTHSPAGAVPVKPRKPKSPRKTNHRQSQRYLK